MRLVACPIAVLAAMVPALPAEARPSKRERPVTQSRHLWATVNVCDTARHPDAIGIRGSMPGSGRRGERMWMRFQVQYRSAADGKWHNIEKGADSGFVQVGRHARYKARQAGALFRFSTDGGRRHVLRGVVTFEWRKGDRVVRRARERTTPGHHVSTADPRGYSRARCVIS